MDNFLDGPALAPPPGVTSNFVNPPNMKHLGFPIVIVCFSVATIVVFLRLFIKRFLVRHLHLDDYLILLAWATYVGWLVQALLSFGPNPGTHQWNVRLRDLREYLWYLHIGSIIYGFSIALLKAAILLQIMRVFIIPGERNALYWVGHTVIWTNIIFYVICTFIEVFGCSPMRKAWDITVTSGKCVNLEAINVASSAFNVLADATILVAPQPVIWSLHMSCTKRAGLSIAFCVGTFATTAAAIKCFVAAKLLISGDITWWADFMGLYSCVEIFAGFLVACVPVIPKLFRRAKTAAKFHNGVSA